MSALPIQAPASIAGQPRAVQPWMQTASGRAFPLFSPEAAEVDFRDVAEGLAKACRFAGQIPVFYSVAQHSVLVAEALPVAARPYGLLHDAHEAFVGDLPSPVKTTLRLYGGRAAWDAMVEGLDAAIHAAAGLPWPPPADIASMVKRADLAALATERRDIAAQGPAWDIALPDPLPRVINPWAWHRALDVFADRCRRWLVLPDLQSMRLGG